MPKNSELPKLRIESHLKEEISETLKKMNENEDVGINLTLPEFRRLALKFFCKDIKEHGLQLEWVTD